MCSSDLLLEISSKCGAELHQILQGKANPLKLLFPPASESEWSVERFYSRAPDLLACNRNLEKVVGAFSYGSGSDSTPVQILEIGAGTGSATAHLLAALQSRGQPFTLTYTDISRVFFKDAREKLRTGPNVEFKVLDIEKDPLAQSFTPASFDVVLGSNVVHATKNVRNTLLNVKAVLRPGGYLLLCEYVTHVMPLDIVFGCLGGWWAFKGNDPYREKHAIMTPHTWSHVLQTSGFDQVHIIGFPVAVIVARLQGGEGGGRLASRAVITPPPAKATAPKREWEPRFQSKEVRASLLRLLVRVTGLEEGDVDEEREFGELGLDSLMLTAMAEALADEFGLHEIGRAHV